MGHLSDKPTYQELRRGWVNTAALLGSGSLIRYESVLECRVGRVASGRALRSASGSGGQPNDDKNCVVLLVAAVHDRHGRPRIHRKTLRGSVRRRARVGSLFFFFKQKTAYEMGDIVEG